MNILKSKGLTAAEITSIIRVGHECKVASLEFDDFKVSYLLSEQASSPQNQEYPQQTPLPEQANNQATPLQQALDEEMQRELMMISDPLKYEESLFLEKEA